MSTLQKKRFDYIDATKGVAILCITFLHFEQGVIPGWLNAWIGLFMITTFYFTSGWVSGMSNKPITAKELFNKRIRQLGVPYLWFSLLIILFDVLWVVLGFMKSDILLRDIYKTIVLRGIGTLWFLPVLFIGEYIFTVMRNSKRVWLWAIVGLAITLFVDYAYKCVELNKLFDATIKPFVRGLYAWPIIALGFLMGRMWGYKILSVAKTKLFIISSFIFAFSLLLVINPPVTIYYINRVSSNILPAIAFMCLFAALSKNIIISFFSFWGVNSIILMCTHFSIIQVMLITFDQVVLHHSTLDGYRSIIYFIITIVLTYPLVWLFNGKLKFMIGK